MRTQYVLMLLLLVAPCFGPSASAQTQQAPTESTRRIIRRTIPVYPDVAKRINLAGTVRLVAVVAADGDVKSVESKGGSPILLKAAEDAVSQWKFAAGSESRETIEVHFAP